MSIDWSHTDEIIQINEQRLRDNNAPYDPLVGTCFSSVIQRNRLDISDAPLRTTFIPVEMEHEPIVRALRKAGSLAKAARGLFGGKIREIDKVRVWLRFCRARQHYDFEFWCITKWHIRDKKTAMLMPFLLNRPQRTVLLPAMEKLRKAGKPIDIILLKARQWGGSTMVDGYQEWIQLEWRVNWNSVICADVDDQAKTVMGMIETAFDNYECYRGEERPSLRPYMRMDSTRIIPSRGCTISIGSARHPEKIRSQDVKMAHLTEVGVWAATPKHKPQDLVQSIFGSINAGPYTMKVLESTAKGTGNYFHITWMDAVTGTNNFTPVFVAWWQIDLYQTSVENYEEFIASLTKYEQWLFSLGATLEAIAWYRIKAREFVGEHWRMCAEYPSDAKEAFQSTGGAYFPKEYVDYQYDNCEDPIFVGDVCGKRSKGAEAMIDIRLVEQERGNLKVWIMPDDSIKMSHRFAISVDVCVGSTPNADYANIYVMDRYWQHEADGVPETAAEWHGHIDVDELAWKAAQLAKLYGDADLVVEKNSIDTNRVKAYRTILSEIKPYVTNLYKKPRSEKSDDNVERENYGFHTNGSSKPQICENLKDCLRDELYIEHCREAVDELKTFERKADGQTLGAVSGCHDDRVMTRAILLYLIYKGKIPPPRFVEDSDTKISKQTTNPNPFTL